MGTVGHLYRVELWAIATARSAIATNNSFNDRSISLPKRAVENATGAFSWRSNCVFLDQKSVGIFDNWQCVLPVFRPKLFLHCTLLVSSQLR